MKKNTMKDCKTGHSDMLRNKPGTIDVNHYEYFEIILEVKKHFPFSYSCYSVYPK